MSKPDKESTRKAVDHWMDSMKERLDHYEVHRNEFLSDMRLPPRNVKFLRDVLLPFCENTLLLDNIAKSEGLCYVAGGAKNRLTIRVRIDGKEVKTTYPELQSMEGAGDISYPDNFPYLLKHKAYKPDQGNNKGENTLYEALNGRTTKANDVTDPDFEICLPHEHAVYSILENVIRNSAKHNAGKFKPPSAANGNGVDTLRINVDITDAGADYWHCTIYDNVSHVRYGVAEEGAERMADLIDMQERKNKPLLADGKPNRANMGMADMKINAFLLKSGKDFTEDDLNEALDIVICDRCTDGGHEHTVVRLDKEKQVKKFVWEKDKEVEKEAPRPGVYFFGYRFKLTKAKKVVWIGEQATAIAKNDDYKRAGIYAYTTWPDYIKSLSDGLAAYEIAVLQKKVWGELSNDKETNKENGKTLREHLASLPYRVLVNSTDSCSVPSPNDRRVVIASLNEPTKDDLLLKALCIWVQGKYKKTLLVRGYWGHELPVTENGPYTWQHEEGGCKVIDLELHTKPVPNGNRVAICGPGDRLWVIDNHGSLANAYKYPVANEGDKEKVFLAYKCLDRAYTFSAKVNPDHDPMAAVLKEIHKHPEEFVSLADRAHRRIVIVDERVAELVAGKDNPHSDFKIQPNDLWAVFAAMNIYVVTQLCIDGEPSFGFETSRKSSLRFFHPASGMGAFDWVVREDMAISNTELYPVLNRTDILVMHRTHWLKFKSKKLDAMLFNSFGDVVITSGAGVAEELHDMKHLSFATLMNFLRSSIASKFRLSQTLDGLTVKPQKQ